MLRVISPNGEVVHEDGITIGNHVPITVHLPERRVETRSRDALVSLQQLRHKIPAAAVKAFLDGKKEASKGHLEAARTHYQRAATIDPEFAAVYNELGVVERGMNHLPEAAAQFQKALNLSPEDSLALPNLSVVLAQMQHYREALEVGRRALKVVSPQAATSVHYILALSLVAEKGDVGEMLLHSRGQLRTIRKRIWPPQTCSLRGAARKTLYVTWDGVRFSSQAWRPPIGEGRSPASKTWAR